MILSESFLSAIKTCLKIPRSHIILIVIILSGYVILIWPLEKLKIFWQVLTFKASHPSLPLHSNRLHCRQSTPVTKISYHCRINHSSYRDSCCQCNNDCTTNTNPVPRPIAATGTAISLLIRSEVRDSGIFRSLN